MPDQAKVQNRLFSLMSAEDFARFAPQLDCVKLPKGHVVVEPGRPFSQVYFVESGVGSIVAQSPEGQQVEAGLFGMDGFTPVEAALGSDRSLNRVVIQIADDAWRCPLPAFREAIEASSSLRGLLLRYVQALHVQTTYTALSNAMHSVEERLARWILMCDDRIDTSEMALTHEFISIMLGVRRPSVTTTLHVLEGNGFIRSERGSITVVNRKALEEFAVDAYGAPEAEYARLIGPLRDPARSWSAR